MVELFREPKIDWLGRKWQFIGLPLGLLAAGYGVLAAVVAVGVFLGMWLIAATLVNIWRLRLVDQLSR